jgi:hypothetical protein
MTAMERPFAGSARKPDPRYPFMARLKPNCLHLFDIGGVEPFDEPTKKSAPLFLRR